jgi:hypothetical protein
VITTYADGSTRPTASNLNYVKAQTIANLVIAAVGTNGKVALFNNSLGTVQLIADVSGYYRSGTPTAAGAFGSLAPARLLDTRVGDGAPATAVAPGATAHLQVSGRGGVPASGVSAVVLNLTVTHPTASGVITAYADGATRPTASNLNYLKAHTIANLVIAPVGTNGKVALFNDSLGTVQLIADVSGYYLLNALAPLAIVTTSLHEGVAGLLYNEALIAAGGIAPYAWSAVGLPAGMTVSTAGILAGTPIGMGTTNAQFQVRDAANTTRTASLTFPVPSAVPAQCAGTACALLKPNGQTVQIPATRVGAINRDADGIPTELLLTGTAPAPGQILVVAPTADTPSGLIVVVDAVSTNSDGTSTVAVTPASPADAYAEGTVNAIGRPVTADSSVTTFARPASPSAAADRAVKPKTAVPNAVRPQALASARPVLSCDSGAISELHGLGVSPTLTPTVAALWKHPIFGGGGIYVGTGGLDLFQFDLDGSITINLGITVSGSSTCTLNLPSFTARMPAGGLGAIILRLEPSITLKVTGKVDIRTSVTLRCGAEYRWSNGHESRVSYCGHSAQPLQLSANSGIDATLTAALDASVTLNDIVGIKGNITAALHAGYQPTQRPIAEIDAKANYNLSACLVCLWKGSPAQVSIVSGSLFNKVLATYDTAPQAAPPAGPPAIMTASLPAGTVGQPYTASLRTADNRNGTWSVSSGVLPNGLTLTDDIISGKPTSQQSVAFAVRFVDSSGRSVTRSESITVSSAGSGGVGAIQNLDYCRQSIISPNDDDSTDAVSLPFSVNLYGSTYDSTYVNNNGYITFDTPLGTFTPFDMTQSSTAIIAPFFADIDTRDPDSALVTYGSSPDKKTFCVNWVDVGYYSHHTEKLNSFQLLLNDRSATGVGNFDITFNYGHMAWETGDASEGTGGIGGTSARAGYSAGTGDVDTSLELPGSGTTGALLDGGAIELRSSSRGANGLNGRDIFPIRN